MNQASFESIHFLAEFIDADKTPFGQISFVALDLRAFENESVHDTEVHFADIGGRIVNQTITRLTVR